MNKEKDVVKHTNIPGFGKLLAAARGLQARKEHNTGEPVSIPVGFQRPPTLAEQVARLVRSSEMRREAQRLGKETFEEADDFDIPDDPVQLTTPYEENFDFAATQAVDRGYVAPPTEEHRLATERVKEYQKNAAEEEKRIKNRKKEKFWGKGSTPEPIKSAGDEPGKKHTT